MDVWDLSQTTNQRKYLTCELCVCAWLETTAYHRKTQTGWKSIPKIPKNRNLVDMLEGSLYTHSCCKLFINRFWYTGIAEVPCIILCLSSYPVILSFHSFTLLCLFFFGGSGGEGDFLLQNRFCWNLNFPAEQYVHRKNSCLNRTAFLEKELFFTKILAGCIVELIWAAVQ